MEWRGPLAPPAVRLVRAGGLVVGGVGFAAVAWFVVLPLLFRGFVRVLELLVAVLVGVATSMRAGVSVWSVLGTLARAAAAALVTPAASAVLAGIALVVLVALYGLQRLLGSEEESSR